MTTAYGQIAQKVDRKYPETRQDDGFPRPPIFSMF
jgi:hypothetical protein